ncbi:hypothetical protein [Pantoea ananatis]|uniref:hypothetical protein n=1 Tax=Pantoea ananas TaxID=553 RepID=UPI000E2270D4|nr:hypothetical protein [Pantoea ananatis]REE77872.1 hypothetical protein C7424_0893 [Pantoea ananatis]BBL31190.1 hypothetical protein PAFU01_26380 [Pantoea ananatis]
MSNKTPSEYKVFFTALGFVLSTLYFIIWSNILHDKFELIAIPTIASTTLMSQIYIAYLAAKKYREWSKEKLNDIQFKQADKILDLELKLYDEVVKFSNYALQSFKNYPDYRAKSGNFLKNWNEFQDLYDQYRKELIRARALRIDDSFALKRVPHFLYLWHKAKIIDALVNAWVHSDTPAEKDKHAAGKKRLYKKMSAKLDILTDEIFHKPFELRVKVKN